MTTRSSTSPELLVKDRVLVIAPHGSYRTSAFIQAAESLGVDVVIASQGEYSIVSDYVRGIHIDHEYSDAALNRILEASIESPFTAIIATDDASTRLAASAAEELGLPHNDPHAVEATQRKDIARKILKKSRVQIPEFLIISTEIELFQQVNETQLKAMFPVVVKPVALSASRGVIRANDFDELKQAIQRNIQMLEKEKQLDQQARTTLLIEAFVPGKEVAVEAMLYHGELEILTIFDKPDPMDGPFFEETYYITPSGLAKESQQQIKTGLQQACTAYGLTEGPVHAEARINDQGVWILEVAARTIGGLCGRLLNYGTGYTLEELVLLQAMGQRVQGSKLEGAAGVLMIPIPGAGIYKRIEGLLDAQRVPYIEEVNIQVREGYELVPLPEGNAYFGFIFALGPSAIEVEQALRKAHACLNIVIAPVWKIGGTL